MVAIEDIENMHTTWTNQIADILHFSDKVFKKLGKNEIKINSNGFIWPS